MMTNPVYKDDESWIELSATIRNVAAFLRIRKSCTRDQSKESGSADMTEPQLPIPSSEEDTRIGVESCGPDANLAVFSSLATLAGAVALSTMLLKTFGVAFRSALLLSVLPQELELSEAASTGRGGILLTASITPSADDVNCKMLNGAVMLLNEEYEAEDSGAGSDSGDTGKDRKGGQEKYVAKLLKDFAAFRARGK